MKTFCIPAQTASMMKDALRKGEIKIAELYNAPDSTTRRRVFEKFASPELALEINTAFEKAMISNRSDAVKEWAKSVFGDKPESQEPYKKITDKVKQLEEAGAISDGQIKPFLNDVVAEKLGVSLTAKEIEGIVVRADRLQKEFSKSTDDGLPTDEYFIARREMDNYINSLTPSSPLAIATSVISRGAMLLSVKSPVINVTSNTVNGVMQALEKRIADKSLIGLNGDFAIEYVKRVNSIYQKSGYDISRMESLATGQRTLGEEVITSQGPGKIREVGRFYEDIVFKQLMGAPDVAFASSTFADSANILSSKLAKGNKEKAIEIFKDAIKIEPKTDLGQLVRAQAKADAELATFTNTGVLSNFGVNLREALNKSTGNVRLGDNLMPFVKTPANYLQLGFDMAGIGFVRGFYRMPEALRMAKLGDTTQLREVSRYFVRASMGLTFAAALVHMIDPDDFVGGYDAMPQEGRNMAGIKNAPYHSIKMGDRFISLDFLGPLAAPFVGMMYAKKYGDNVYDLAYNFTRGAWEQSLRIPGLNEISDLYNNILKSVKEDDYTKVGEGVVNNTIGFLRARVIPAIVSDVAKAIDPNERDTGKNEFSKFQAGIPLWRQSLPEKINELTGETVKAEPGLSVILFGSRVKTAEDNPIVKEIDRLAQEDSTPTITSVGKSSKRMKELREQIGKEKFDDAIKYYAEQFSENTEKIIKTDSYKKAVDESKQKKINKVREDAIEKTLKKFGYKKPEVKK